MSRPAATRAVREFYQRVPIDRWFMAHVRPVGTTPSMIILVFQDLTPLRRSEEMRVDFVANASHELRTPLAALSGFIDTLQGSARDDAEARKRFLAIMKAQANRMTRLIGDLLSLSRVELNEHMHPETPVDVVPVVRQVIDGLQTLATDRGVEIAIDAAGRADDGAGRSRRTHARFREPDRERAEIWRERQACRCRLLGRSGIQRSAGHDPRLRTRHRGRTHPAADRALLSRRCHAKPRRRRHRSWASRWSSTSSTGTAASSPSTARPGKGATFTVRLPLVHSESKA